MAQTNLPTVQQCTALIRKQSHTLNKANTITANCEQTICHMQKGKADVWQVNPQTLAAQHLQIQYRHDDR